MNYSKHPLLYTYTYVITTLQCTINVGISSFATQIYGQSNPHLTNFYSSRKMLKNYTNNNWIISRLNYLTAYKAQWLSQDTAYIISYAVT